MKIRLCLLLGAGLVLASQFFSAAQTQRGQTVRIRVETGQELDLYDESHALVIGVSDYTSGWRKLPGVRADVAEISRVLKAQGFNVTTLLDPTVDQFHAALRRFRSLYGQRERNRLLLYFAGHGHTERTSAGLDLGYVVMRDAPLPGSDPGGFSAAAVSMDEINSYALSLKAKHALFVFDSCFSGTIFRSESNRRAPPRIASMTAQPVRQFITAGDAGQSVPDDSLFRHYFVRAFEQRAGDLDDDGFITGEELGQYLTGVVASDSRETQTPRYGKIREAKLNLGDVVFVLPAKAATPTPAPTPVVDPAQLELSVWQSAERGNTPGDYEEYLRQYPNGRYAGFARNRLAQLRAAANVTAPATPPARRSVTGEPLVALSFTTANVNAQGQKINERTAQCWGFTDTLPGGVALEMVEVAGGEFWMGEDAAGAAEYERECLRAVSESFKQYCKPWAQYQTPRHRVTVKSFAMGKYEVTQRQWKAVMGSLPEAMNDLSADFKGDDLPVVRVSWEDVQSFLKKLGKGYRLPSEAEWEFAARAGSTTAFAFGPTISPAVVNYDGNYPHGQAAKGEYRQHPVRVGSFPANAWGLFDMHGNVWEWCEDHWHDSYSGAPSDGRAWVDISATGSYRVDRGGGWNCYAVVCRSAYRSGGAPGGRVNSLGFRLVRT